MPLYTQLNAVNRWQYKSDKMMAQFGVKALYENRLGGQVGFRENMRGTSQAYGFGNTTRRVEFFSKTAKMYQDKPYKGLGFIVNGLNHTSDSYFGFSNYNARQQTLYANLIYQSIIDNTNHKFTTGLSYLLDDYNETYKDIHRSNPSELLISPDDAHLSGSAIAASLEGLRPLLLETQALVSPAIYGTPQRSATGFDLRRFSMLLAVLEKRCGLSFGQNDVFLNIAGGIKVTDPSIDLAIVAALISSLQDIHISKKICFAGEVGLLGEIRPVSRIDQRIQEAGRLGFETIFISKYKSDLLPKKDFGVEVRMLTKIDDLLRDVFA